MKNGSGLRARTWLAAAVFTAFAAGCGSSGDDGQIFGDASNSANGATGPLALNLGSAAGFGIASRAGLTSTGVTVVNGNVNLDPNAVWTDATGNAGAAQTCLVKPYASPTGMTVNGTIYWAGDGT